MSAIRKFFLKLLKKSLLDNEIDIAKDGGVAFDQFLMLFNSIMKRKGCHRKYPYYGMKEISLQIPKIDMYNIECLVANNYQLS